MATKDNVVHPTIKIGDIILQLKGRIITSADEYYKLQSTSGANELEILRFNGDKMEIVKSIIPADCEVLVSFLDLKESE